MDFDYVIVGGGSAGCVLAGRLSADPATRVCLIEAGPDDDHVLCRVPFATAMFVPGKWRNWAFQTVPQAGLDGRRGYQPRGRMLGGSSGINAMIYIRGHPSDYDDWAAQGADRLVVRRRAALLQARGGQRAPRRHAARQRRPAQCRRSRQPQPAQRHVSRSLRPAAAAAQPRLQRRDPGGRRPLPGDAEERRALERGARLPAAGGRASGRTCGSPPARARCACAARAGAPPASSAAAARDARRRSTPAARSSCRPAPSSRRSSCCCRASARRTSLQRHGIAVAHALPGVGRNLQDHLDFTLIYKAKSPHLFGFTPAGAGAAAARDPALAARAARAAHDQLRRVRRLPEDRSGAAAARHPAALRPRPGRRSRAQAPFRHRLQPAHLRAAPQEPRQRRPRRCRSR